MYIDNNAVKCKKEVGRTEVGIFLASFKPEICMVHYICTTTKRYDIKYQPFLLFVWLIRHIPFI